MKKLILNIFMITMIIGMAGSAYSVTLGEFTNPLEEYLECKDLDGIEKLVCPWLAKEVYGKLAENKFSLNNGDIVYTDESLFPIGKVLGNCSTQISIKGGYLQVALSSETELTFEGNSISEPNIIIINAPITAIARVGLKTEYGAGSNKAFGIGSFIKDKYESAEDSFTAEIDREINDVAGEGERFIGTIDEVSDRLIHDIKDIFECRVYGQDSWYITADVKTTIQLVSIFSLEPKFLGVNADGDYEIEIKPVYFLYPILKDFDYDFDPHGQKAELNAFITFIAQSATLGEKMIKLPGELEDSETFENYCIKAGTEFGLNVGISLGLLYEKYADLEDIDYVNKEVMKEIASLWGSEVETRFTNQNRRINEQIKDILHLDSDGKRIYTIEKADIVAEYLSWLTPVMSLILW